MREVAGWVVEALVERGLGGDDERVHRDDVAALPALPDARLGNELRIPGERGARYGAEALVERDVHAVEEPGDLGVGTLVVRHRLPEPRAVHVQRYPSLARPAGLCAEVVPFREQAADLSLGKLEQERGDRLPDRLEVLEPDQTVRVADEPRAKAVEALVCALLVQLEMTGRMEGDCRDPTAVAPDAERDRLRHRAARHEDRSLLAEELRDPGLEPLDALARTVRVHPLAGARRLGDRGHPLPRPRAAVPRVQVAVGAGDRRSDPFVVGHGPEPIPGYAASKPRSADSTRRGRVARLYPPSSTAATRGSELRRPPGELLEAPFGHLHVRQWVLDVRVEPGGDEHKVRLERVHGWLDEVGEHREVVVVP